MRKLFLLFAASAVVFTGCLKISDEHQNLQTIAPGVTIYDNLKIQNDVSLDPAGAAIRLGMLLSEMEKTGATDINSIVVTYNQEKIVLAKLLFGSASNVEKDGDDYIITYSTKSAQRLDVYSRSGKFRISTGGMLLENSSEPNPWSVAVVANEKGANEMTYNRQSFGGRTLIMGNTGGLIVHNTGDGYKIVFYASECHFDNKIRSGWNGEFTFKPSKTEGGLSFSNLTGAKFRLEGQASGTLCVTFKSVDNATTGVAMNYAIGSDRPLLYNPSIKQYNQIIDGEENVSLIGDADYEKYQFPAKDVKYIWFTTDEVYLSCEVTYNGASYIYNF